MAASPLGYTLWAGTVGFTSPLAERFAASTATGCRQATLSPPDVLRAAEDGTTAAEIGRQARDLGLDLVIAPVMNWYPDRAPPPPGGGAGVPASPRSRPPPPPPATCRSPNSPGPSPGSAASPPASAPGS